MGFSVLVSLFVSQFGLSESSDYPSVRIREGRIREGRISEGLLYSNSN